MLNWEFRVVYVLRLFAKLQYKDLSYTYTGQEVRRDRLNL